MKASKLKFFLGLGEESGLLYNSLLKMVKGRWLHLTYLTEFMSRILTKSNFDDIIQNLNEMNTEHRTTTFDLPRHLAKKRASDVTTRKPLNVCGHGKREVGGRLFEFFNIFCARYLANENELSHQTSCLNYSQWGL